jgi:hypothetical protein
MVAGENGLKNGPIENGLIQWSLQERGLPIWEIFHFPARSGTGTPRMVMGIGVFAFP